MRERKRRRRRTVATASLRVTERLNAVYGEDGSASVLDEALETLQFLSMPSGVVRRIATRRRPHGTAPQIPKRVSLRSPGTWPWS